MFRHCPNCGGNKVSVTTRRVEPVEPDTGRRIPMVPWGQVIGVLSLSTVIYFVLLGADQGNHAYDKLFNGLIAFDALIGFGGATALVFRHLFYVDHASTLHRYYWYLCGMQWSWREDQRYPYPAGTLLAPDADRLRMMGEQRLAEEEARRRADEAG